jgi:hypothetical protein
MKRLLLLIGILSIAKSNYSQSWERTYGTSNDEYCFSVQQTSDGGFIMAGQKHLAGLGHHDFYVVKTDQEGGEVWSKLYGGTDFEAATSVLQTKDDGYVIAGTTFSFGNGASDFYVIRTDSNGTEIWSNTYGGTSGDSDPKILATLDGGFVMAGWTQTSGWPPFPHGGSDDVFLVKIDSLGNELWNRKFGGDNIDQARSIVSTSDGGYALFGMSTSDINGTGNTQMGAYLIKVDQDGSELWSRKWDEIDGEILSSGFSVDETKDGGFILTGHVGNSQSSNERDIFLVRTDMNGQEIWSQSYGGALTEFGNAVHQTKDGGYAVTGSTESFGLGNFEVYFVKTDSTGIEERAEYFGGASTDRGTDFQITKDNGYVLTGRTESSGGGKSDFYLIRLPGDGPNSVQGVEEPINQDNGPLLKIMDLFGRPSVPKANSIYIEIYDNGTAVKRLNHE